MTSVNERIRACLSKAVGLLNDAQTPLLAAIRLFWGWQFTMTGWGKLHHLDHVTEFFATLNLPMPGTTAIFVAMVEFLGGVFLALGLGTRVVALILFVNMSVAFWTADREALMSFFAAPEKFYGADPFPFWAVALLLAAFGPGRWAADRWLIPYVQGVEKA